MRRRWKHMDVTLLKQRDGKLAEDRGSSIEYRGSRIALRAMTRLSILDLRSSILFGVFCVLLLIAQVAQAQSGDRELLPDRLGQKWRAVSPARILDEQRLSSLPDADVRAEYGLRRIIRRVYTDGRVESSVE